MKKKYEFSGDFKFLKTSQYLLYYLLISAICTIALMYMIIYHIVSETTMYSYMFRILLCFGIVSYLGVHLYLTRTLSYIEILSMISLTNDNLDKIKLYLFKLNKEGDMPFNAMIIASVNAIALQVLTFLIPNESSMLIYITINVIMLLYNCLLMILCGKTTFNINRNSKSIINAINKYRNNSDKIL